MFCELIHKYLYSVKCFWLPIHPWHHVPQWNTQVIVFVAWGGSKFSLGINSCSHSWSLTHTHSEIENAHFAQRAVRSLLTLNGSGEYVSADIYNIKPYKYSLCLCLNIPVHTLTASLSQLCSYVHLVSWKMYNWPIN